MRLNKRKKCLKLLFKTVYDSNLYTAVFKNRKLFETCFNLKHLDQNQSSKTHVCINEPFKLKNRLKTREKKKQKN